MATLNDIETKIQSIISILKSRIVKTITGILPLTFTTQTAGAAIDWSISGNDNIGKNLLEITANTQTVNGVTFTVDKETGTITANGNPITTGQTILLEIGVINFLAGDYTLSGCPVGGGASTYRLDIRPEGGSSIYDNIIDVGNGKNFTLSEDNTLYVYLRLWSSSTFDNIVFSPMVRLSNASADFEPNQIGVGQRTENLYDYDNTEITDWIINASGQQQTTPEYRYRTQYITVIPSGVYTFRWAQAVQPGTSTPYIRICFFNNGTFISRSVINSVTIVSKTVAITMPANCNKILVQCDDKTSKNGQYFVDIMLVEGSTAPANFVPYGYEIPLTVNNTTQDIYIGSTPLSAGQSVSKTSTGVDLALFEGENTVSTTLYNKPEMTIKYKYNGGN